MEAQARTPHSRSQIMGCSSMFRFLRSLVGSSSKAPDKASSVSSRGEQEAVSPRTSCQGGRRRRERPHATPPWVLSTSSSRLPLQEAFDLGTGDMGDLTSAPTETLRLRAQGPEVTPVPQPDKEEEKGEKEVSTEEASGDSGTSHRDHFAQDLDIQQRFLSLIEGTLAPSPNVSIREEEEEEEEEGQCLVEGDLRSTSPKVGSTPWNYILSWYKQIQKSAMAKRGVCPQFSPKEGLLQEEKGEEGEKKEEESLFKPCIPRIMALHSQLNTTFRSTDTVGFMQSELKKILEVRRASRLWKVDSPDNRKLLTQPEITLEEAGIINGQNLLMEEVGEMGSWPPE